MEKMKKTAKGIDVFLKVLQIALIVFLALTLIADVGFLLRGGEAGSLRERFSAYALSLNGILITPELAEVMEVDFAALWWGTTLLFQAAGIALFFGIRLLRQILRPMTAGKPFEQSVSRDLSRFGWFVLIMGAVLTVLREVTSSFLMRSVNFHSVSETSVTVGVSHGINLTFVFVAAILFLTSYIFRYGEELQRQSDETL